MAVTKRYAHINQASNATQNKLDAESAYITGSLQVQGQITGSSPVRLQNSLLVQGASQFDDVAKFGNTAAAEAFMVSNLGGLPPNLDLVVSGTVVVGDMLAAFSKITGMADLDIMGKANIRDLAQVGGNLEVQNQITGSGPVRFQNTLEVQGNADMRTVLPNGPDQYALGSVTKRWKEVFVKTLNAATVSAEVLSASVDADLNGTLHVEGASTFVGAVSLEQLTGSAGARFTGGNVKVEAGEVSASSDLKAGGELKVASHADINGNLDVALASDLHGAVVAYSTLNVQGAADLDRTLNVDGIAEFQDDVYAKADLNVSGALAVALTANVAGNFTVATNKFTVAASSGDTAVAGDLIVSGDLTVMGDRIEAQVTQLVVEDGLITLMSGSTSRAMSNGAGIEVEVGGEGQMPAIKFANALGGASGSWVSNLDWIPSEDLKYDLGIASKRWRELNLSGDANVGGALDVAGAASVGALAAASLAVAGAATFAAGIAVTGTGSFTGAIDAASAALSGDLQAVNGTFSANVSAVDATLSGDLTAVNGSFSANIDAVDATLSGDLSAVNGSFSANIDAVDATLSGDLSAVNGSFSANIDAVDATLSGDLSANDATLSGDLTAVGGTFSGNLSAVSASLSGDLTVAKDATFGGKATFNGSFVVPGTGSFGALVVKGVDLSPISASLSSTNEQKASGLEFALASGEMMKLEVEVMAKNIDAAAGFKYSITARNTGSDIVISAVEIVKEILGDSSKGALLDVEITEDNTKLALEVKSSGIMSIVYWNLQVVKKMKMAANGSPVEDRI